MQLTVVTWNVEWAKASTRRGSRIAEILAGLGADIIVLTEGCADLLPDGGHLIDAGPAWGYEVKDPQRRKVLSWSAQPWTEVDPTGSPDLPGGRWIAGTTDTPLGPIRVAGVCVPWRAAHVSTGRKDRAAWDDHLSYLRAMPSLLRAQPLPALVVGDLNQRIPRTTQPAAAAEALASALQGFEIPTAGTSGHEPLIDHIAHSPGLRAVRPVTILPAQDESGPLSDHLGVVLHLAMLG